MKRCVAPWLLAAALFLLPSALVSQGGFGRGGMGGAGRDRFGPSAPKLPGVELQGPLDTALARVMLSLTDQQAKNYTQAYDSFMVATRPQRDSAGTATAKMNERLEQGDRAAAMFYAERLQDIGKYLKDRQDRFESNLRRWFNGDQIKEYKKWKEGEEQAAERKRREDELHWQEASFGGFGGRDRAAQPELKTSLPSAAGVAAAALGSQAVLAGRTLYVTGQLGVDSAGTLAGADLRTQAQRAFANLGAVLQAAGATPRDVISLTIYVVNYRPADLATIREAGAAYFGSNAPIATVLGVQSLDRDGALVSIAATALATAAPLGRAR